MQAEVFTPEAKNGLETAYPARATRLTHRLTSHPLLDLEALVTLAAALPPEAVEYNPGKLPIGIAPEDVPAPELGVAETIRSIEQAGAWMVLKRIESHPAYAQLLDAILDEITAIVTPRTGAMLRREGFIFISSPGSVTPFHFDPEHNILLQVRGTKTMTVFPGNDETMFDPQVHEAFHLGEHHRNLPWQDEYAAFGEAITIQPGEAIHVPVKSPHWVQNHDGVSISLSVTWRSEWSFAEADARAMNRVMRRAGLAPRSPAPWPARNLAKSLAYRALRKVGV
ncbi:cupin-like domain-containing protein [Novosphingobium sp.]|uniref:cupin-like domain-containing protein n=1 Tax=Novosphingobium sp. TaxID=1874826 RepID=UPI0025D885D7|nr:cupin-like domain-containing protein [Novosphingobium sp.]